MLRLTALNLKATIDTLITRDNLARGKRKNLVTHPRQHALGRSLLYYVVALVLVLTLFPFNFEINRDFNFSWYGDTFDILCNVVLFIPIGFLYHLVHQQRFEHIPVRALGCAFALSCTIEISQLFLDNRYTSVSDILANGFGGWCGAWLFISVRDKVDERAFTLLALELPLMNSVYLLIPHLWLQSITVSDEPQRLVMMLPVALIGAVVFSAVYNHRLRQRLGVGAAVIAAMVWFALSTAPALVAYPLAVLGIDSVIGLTVFCSVRWGTQAPRERRFEIPVLKRVLVVFSAYLLMLFLWPLTGPGDVWVLQWLPAERFHGPTFMTQLRYVEFVTAFTLLGYLVAEFHGRSTKPPLRRFGGIAVSLVAAAAGLESLRGFHPDHGASVMNLLLCTAAAGYGAVLYHLQIEAVKKIMQRLPVNPRYPRLSPSR